MLLHGAAAQVFNALGGNTWSSLAKLRACIGDVAQDADNPLLEAEMKRQQGGKETGEVYILPTIRINNGQYRGKLSYTEVRARARMHPLHAHACTARPPPGIACADVVGLAGSWATCKATLIVR